MAAYDYNMRRPLTQLELIAEIENMSDDDIDAVLIPPEVDELTDEENVDDNIIGTETIPSDVTGTFEIHSHTMSSNKQEASESKRKRITKSKEYVLWEKETQPNYSITSENNENDYIRAIQASVVSLTPVEVFSLYFTDEIFNKIVEFSNIYSKQQNRHDFHLTSVDLRKFIGILILSGYHSLPQQRMYWSLDSDKGLEIVRKCMPRNRFESIKRNIHLSDNSDLDKGDKFTKLRPIFDMMNERYLQFGIFSHNLSIDEEMVPYFGRHSAKMFIKNKPVRFGFKIWCLASADGYLFQFIPYGGANNKRIMEDQGCGQGGQVVIDLLSVIKNPREHRIFFDNFFSSHKLFKYLCEKQFSATGTIRDNRIANCPLESTKSLGKKVRGSYDSGFDKLSEILIVRWNDNSVVTIATNNGTVLPLVNAKRYDRKQKKEVAIPQPNVISDYNKYMGGVDLHDNGIANYRIRIRGKKWWWPLFINLIDSAIVNGWKIYNIGNKEQMSQVDFRSYIALALMNLESEMISKNFDNFDVTPATSRHIGRPQNNHLPREIRFDNVGHIIKVHDEKARRRCLHCKNQSIFMCKKCNVHLHPECFETFHTK